MPLVLGTGAHTGQEVFREERGEKCRVLPGEDVQHELNFLSAGVWHNFVLCLAALAFIFLMPVFLFPLYSTGGGALVTEVVQVGAAAVLLPFSPRAVAAGLMLVEVSFMQL